MTSKLEITIKADLISFLEWLDEEIMYHLPSRLTDLLIYTDNDKEYKLDNFQLRKVKKFEPYPHINDTL